MTPRERRPAWTRWWVWVIAAGAAPLVLAALVFGAGLTDRTGQPGGSADVGEPRTGVRAADVNEGDCVAEWVPQAAEYTVVACDHPHVAQLISRPDTVPWLRHAEDGYPGAYAIAVYMEEACRQVITRGLSFDLDSFALDPQRHTHYESPSRTAWLSGSTRGWCWIVAPDGGSFSTSYYVGQD